MEREREREWGKGRRGRKRERKGEGQGDGERETPHRPEDVYELNVFCGSFLRQGRCHYSFRTSAELSVASVNLPQGYVSMTIYCQLDPHSGW